MDSKKQEQAAGIPAIGGEIRSLKQHGSATMAELSEFVASMRGKSAKEMLGALAESGLVRATIQATVGCIVLMAAFTVGPYYVWGGKAEAKPTSPASSAKEKPDATAQTPAPEATDDSAKNASASADTPAVAKTKDGEPVTADQLDKAAKKLGIGETKTADPKVNPLDKELDLLLDKK